MDRKTKPTPAASKEKKLALLVTIATAVCFIGGALFGYALISKPALTFLFGLSEAVSGPLPFKIEPFVRMEEMVSFMVSMLLGSGAAFELPVVLGVLGWLGLVNARGLWRFNKYALIRMAVRHNRAAGVGITVSGDRPERRLSPAPRR